MIAAIGLILGVVAGLIFEPVIPLGLQPFLPVAVVAALDALFGAFRAWLEGEYGIKLPSAAWGRDWEPFVQLCFDACYDIDAKALSPIGGIIYKMNEAA